ncbi:MAG: RNA polymerase sigma factor SigJ [Planctomycetaceae bacterium]|nr:RNA polymerase sigma factor SigJ [Planctomycetaceae bacterium]
MSDARLETHRQRLVGLAYRMLGSVDDAEEAAQEAFLRYQAAGAPDVDNLQAWLTRVCVRICLDRIKRSAATQEVYPGQWLPEPFVDAENRAAIDETLSMALLVGMRQLSAAERAVFLLHDIFDYRFAEVADILDLSADNCRQLAVRARRKIRRPERAPRSSSEEFDRVTGAFLAAVRDGDIDRLRDLLAENVRLTSDGGGQVSAAPRPIAGRDKVATFLHRVFAPARKSAVLRETPVHFNGAPGVLLTAEGHSPSAYHLEIDDGRIVGIFVQRNPDKLRRLLRSACG